LLLKTILVIIHRTSNNGDHNETKNWTFTYCSYEIIKRVKKLSQTIINKLKSQIPYGKLRNSNKYISFSTYSINVDLTIYNLMRVIIKNIQNARRTRMKKLTLSIVAVMAMGTFAIAGGDIAPVEEPMVEVAAPVV